MNSPYVTAILPISAGLASFRRPLSEVPPDEVRIGQAGDGAAPSVGWSTLGWSLAAAGTVLGAYHGYARNRSVGWGIAWALLGGAFPLITIPVSLAQGFGKPAGR